MVEGTFAIRRAHARFAFSAEAEATLRDGTSVPAQVLELSSRGCYIDAIEPIPIGTELRLLISNGMNVCELPGTVIYMHPGSGMALYGMGVVFGDISSEQRVALDGWLRQLATDSVSIKPN
jgi:hypothetical protein